MIFGVTNPGPGRGLTMPSTSLVHLKGARARFPDMDGIGSDAVRRSERDVVMQLVQNKHSTVILPGAALTYDSSYLGYGVELATSSGGVPIQGIADCFLPSAGVAVDEWFWMCISGPTKMINDANAEITAGLTLMGSTSVAGAVRAATGNTMAAIQSIVGQSEAVIAVSTAGFCYFKSPVCGM